MCVPKGPYRRCVGIALINQSGKVFVGKRINDQQNAWQMPQGGINKGELPIKAAHRELLEETSVSNVHLIAQMDQWLYYDIPKEVSKTHWLSRRYKGQKQMWFLLYFKGNENEININTKIPEFCQWQWSCWHEVCDNVIFFKKDVYKKVMETFQPIAKRYLEEISVPQDTRSC